MAQFRIRVVQIPRWQMAIAAVLLIALLAALFVLALGVFLIVLPFALAAAALAWFFRARAPPSDRGDGQTIDGEYRVLDRKSLERDRDG